MIGRAVALVTVTVTAMAWGAFVLFATPRQEPGRPAPRPSPTRSESFMAELDVPWRALIAQAAGLPERDVESRLRAPLTDLEVITPSDVWAVGSRTPADSRRWHEETTAVLMRWDGRRWRPVAPPPGMRFPDLVAASSSDNVWVIENHRGVQRWDGRAWSDMGRPRVTDPAVPKAYVLQLESVAVTSPREAWVAGTAYRDSDPDAATFPFLARRTASGWSQIDSPGGMDIEEIDAVSPEDVWAVGHVGGKLAVAHWDGRRWRLVPSPTAPAKNGDVRLRAVSPAEVWVTVSSVARVMRWDGRRWHVLPPPTGRACQVEGDGRGSAWILAKQYTKVQPRVYEVSTVLLRYDGRRWSVEKPPRSFSECRGTLARAPDTGRLIWAADFAGE
ncbi:hypothetical protein ACFSKW_00890 [Nonomuraea mangrovi]|uniref:WD40 repeat domain-containing protein n=1 Tax=Nonomuraea mangrovi TaxID=2316207 RepID=A0ABW4SKZ5_9ACTN